jgi:hypothetical protein
LVRWVPEGETNDGKYTSRPNCPQAIAPWCRPRSDRGVIIMSALTVTSTGTNPSEWQAWWREEAIRTGSDWRSLLRQHQGVFRRLCEHVGASP